ncbi:hypothetical protein B0T42_16940 [Rathayibacter sp. VKM Ac-2630]|nr:hypothetical protein B0T42_16940 [Rathayibacter sp. VKM Ac-2630]
MGVISIVLTSLVVLVFALGGGGFEETSASAVQAGTVVLAHIGWAFGVNVPVLLSFYLLIAGQDLRGRPSATLTRRRLGFVAELLTASLVPPILLVLVAAAEDRELLGALLLIGPSFAVLVFLAAQLGTFIAFDYRERRDAAQREKEWLSTRLGDLAGRAGRAPIVVLVVNTVTAAAVAGLATLFAGVPVSTVVVKEFSFLVVAFLLSTADLLGLFLLLTGRGTSEKVTSTVGPAVVTLLVLIFPFSEMVAGRWETGMGFVAVIGLVTASSLLQRRGVEGGLFAWTLNSAGTSWARSALERRLARATSEIEGLNASDEEQRADKDVLFILLMAAGRTWRRASSASSRSDATRRR